uniref:Uncharacterized protein n=1 Tax=viral metagenome TaxID=1070528 RepID=A0A6M3IIS2_9ZZZZ
MARPSQEDVKFRYVRYIGPKSQKRVNWIEGSPIFNKGNNFTAEIGMQEAAKLISKCPNIFKLVSDPNEPIKKAAQIPPKPVEKPVQTPNEKHQRMIRRKKIPTPSQLFGKADGTSFPSELVARGQIHRMAKKLKVDKATLTVVKLADGYWITSVANDIEGGDDRSAAPKVEGDDVFGQNGAEG